MNDYYEPFREGIEEAMQQSVGGMNAYFRPREIQPSDAMTEEEYYNSMPPELRGVTGVEQPNFDLSYEERMQTSPNYEAILDNLYQYMPKDPISMGGYYGGKAGAYLGQQIYDRYNELSPEYQQMIQYAAFPMYGAGMVAANAANNLVNRFKDPEESNLLRDYEYSKNMYK